MDFTYRTHSINRLFKATCPVILAVLFFSVPAYPKSDDFTHIAAVLSHQDAALLANPAGEILFSRHADAKRIPASTLKILTSLAALHYLGEDYRFATEFFLDQDANLTIKGYGDPLLISEEIEKIAIALKSRISEINDIVLDDTFFEKPLIIPGTAEGSLEPYDAPNGALCVNFNTVNFKKNGHTIVSAEPQTPMVALAREKIKKSGLSSGRVLLTNDSDEITRYAGQIFQNFLAARGIKISGTIRLGMIDDKNSLSSCVYRHVSTYDLTEIIARLLEYSNNFIANQLLLAAGAAACGPPASMEKGVKATQKYIHQRFDEAAITFVEGSGISRNNRSTARVFLDLLMEFRPWYRLMTYNDNVYYKTGTLDGISTRAGYLVSEAGDLYPFVVFVNTPGKSAIPVINAMKALIAKPAGPKQ
jgi:D-alanyl-D-alanine carboxypeptidase/D-alanyl-D-alanine-endopeptidase (penicillin-binding protein 4)